MSVPKNCWVILGMGLLVVGSLSRVVAKPPDLPIDYRDTLMPSTSAAVPVADSIPVTSGIREDTPRELACLLLARQLYRLGQRCLQKGERDMAYNCFHEVHLLAPTSRYGLLALQQLQTWGNGSHPDTGIAEIQEPATLPGVPSVGVPETRSAPDTSETSLPVPQRRLAQHLYRLGKRCQRRGDYALAIVCYQEVQHLCPDSRYADRAAKRLRELQSSSPPSPADSPD